MNYKKSAPIVYDRDLMLESLKEFKQKCKDVKVLIENKLLGYSNDDKDNYIINLENAVGSIKDIGIEERPEYIAVFGDVKMFKDEFPAEKLSFGIRGYCKDSILEDARTNREMLKIITFDVIGFNEKERD